MDFASCPSGTDRTTGTVGISRELSYTNSPVSVHLLFSFLPFFFRFSSMTNCCCYNQLYKSLSQQSLKLLCDILGHFSSLLCLGSMTSNTFFFSFCVCVDQIWKEMDSFATCWIHQPPLIIRNGNRISVSYYSEKGNHRLVIEHQLKDHEVESCTVISNMNCSLFRPTIIR